MIRRTGGDSRPARASADVETRSAAYRQHIETTTRRLASLDSFDAIAALQATHAFFDTDTHSEPDSAQMVAAAELGAQLIASMPYSTGTASAAPMQVVREVHDLLRACVWLSAGDDSSHGSPVEDLRRRFVGQTRLIRNVARDEQEYGMLQSLFESEPMCRLARKSLGMTAAEALRATDWIAQRSAYAAELLEKRPEGRGLGRAIGFTVERLAADTGLDPDRCNLLLEELSMPLGATKSPTIDDDGWAPRLRPLVAAHGRFVCTVPANLLRALRPLFERRIKADTIKGWERYQRRRSTLTERRTQTILETFLRPEVVLTNATFVSQAGSGECDLVALLDDTAILVEVKSGTLRAHADLRDGGRFRRALADLIVTPTKQLEKARSALLRGGTWRDADGKPFELASGHIRRCVTVIVTQEDLSFAAPVLWNLQRAGLLSGQLSLPWLVSTDQLASICQVLEWPAQLIHYLQARARLDARRTVQATDEIDVFMAYLNGNLDFEAFDDPDVELILLPNGTDQLYRWFMYRQGLRSVSTRRPQQVMASEVELATRAELRRLDSDRPPGWLLRSVRTLDRALHASPAHWNEVGPAW